MSASELLAALPTAQRVYIELAGGDHGAAWTYAYADSMMFKWAFQQSKQGVTPVRPEQQSSRPATPARVHSSTVEGVRVDLRGRVSVVEVPSLRGLTVSAELP
jgi:hypothetical protein